MIGKQHEGGIMYRVERFDQFHESGTPKLTVAIKFWRSKSHDVIDVYVYKVEKP